MKAVLTICATIFLSGTLVVSISVNEVENDIGNADFGETELINLPDLLRRRRRARNDRTTVVVVEKTVHHCPANQEYDESKDRCVRKKSLRPASAIHCTVDKYYDERTRMCTPKSSSWPKRATDCAVDKYFDERNGCVYRNPGSSRTNCNNGWCNNNYDDIPSYLKRHKAHCRVAVGDRTCPGRIEFVTFGGCPVAICLRSANKNDHQVSYSTVGKCFSNADCHTMMGLSFQKCMNNVCRYNALPYNTPRFCRSSNDCKYGEECAYTSNTCRQRRNHNGNYYYDHQVVHSGENDKSCFFHLCPSSHTCRRGNVCWPKWDSFCLTDTNCDFNERCKNGYCELRVCRGGTCEYQYNNHDSGIVSSGIGFVTHFVQHTLGRRK